MDSEDILFILYTSGSTGKPKGVAHTTAGYLLYAAMTTNWSFNLEDGDIYACVADCGWITGHSYIVYGPLMNGATTIMFESVPTHPDPYRYWDLVQKHKVTQFYTAPTAIRTLMRFDAAPIKNYDLSTLRILGSVGEPINPEAWKWYDENVGQGRCSIVDTYWQTETGGHLATNIPGVMPQKPGSCALPYFGIEFAIVDPVSGKEITTQEAEGVLCIKKPWPSIARTVYGDHDRYLSVYMRPYPGYYFTGDGCRRDKDGYYWITGRVDDVINPSGHRIGTAEVESALVACPAVSEAAVIGFPHEIKGEGIGCFVILREGFQGTPELTTQLKSAVRAAIGPIATPDIIVYSDLPKTRSGKIMRRILRKVAAGEEDSIGDISTLADPSAVARLVESFKIAQNTK
jgi:acetyl-CoA synthetase